MYIKNCLGRKKIIVLITLTVIAIYILSINRLNSEQKPLIKVIQPGDLGVGAPKCKLIIF
jgi:hypothetical protein